MRTCQSCSYFILTPQENEFGECRRFPPVFVGVVPKFPVISSDEWCGEFRMSQKETNKLYNEFRRALGEK